MPPRPARGYKYDYPRPAVTVDIALVTRAKPLRVLLIQRKNEPVAGAWALPGGFVDESEPLPVAAARELVEETGVEAEELEQLHAFGDPGRDPRGWTISVAFLARVDQAALRPEAADDAREVKWFSLAKLPALAFDHAEILKRVRTRIQDRTA